MSRVISETVQHAAYNGSGADSHRNVMDSWAAATPVGVYAFDPGGSTEPLVPGHERVVTKPTLFMPSTVVFAARDRVTARGLLYEVDGETSEWRHPGGAQRGNVQELRRVTG